MYIVIVGGSMTAEFLISAMQDQRHRVTVIEEDLETTDRLIEVLPKRATVVMGDGCDSEIQRDAGVADADLFIALTGHDETNLVACEIAMTAFDVPRCIASVRSPKNERIFKEVGIEPVSSTDLIARMVEEEAVIGDMRMVFSLREGDITMVETKMPTRMKHKEGIAVADIALPRQANFIAVVRDGDFEMINPDTRLMPGETVIAAAKADAEEEFLRVIKRL